MSRASFSTERNEDNITWTVEFLLPRIVRKTEKTVRQTKEEDISAIEDLPPIKPFVQYSL